MNTVSNTVVVEIPEDAYKQNTVYRPWPEIEAGDKSTSQDAPSPQQG